MLSYCEGRIFQSNAAMLVNFVSLDAAPTLPLSLELMKRYPSNHIAYQAACLTGDIEKGRPFFFKLPCHPRTKPPAWIANIAVCDRGNPTTYQQDWFAASLDPLKHFIETNSITSVALECPDTELSPSGWVAFRRLVDRELSDLNTSVLLFPRLKTKPCIAPH